jgi:hypothetical protein
LIGLIIVLPAVKKLLKHILPEVQSTASTAHPEQRRCNLVAKLVYSSGWLMATASLLPPILQLQLPTKDVEIISQVLLLAVGLLLLFLITKSLSVGIPRASFYPAGMNPRPRKSSGLYCKTTSLLYYLVTGTTLGSLWLVIARLTTSGHTTAPPMPTPVTASPLPPPRWYIRRPYRVGIVLLSLILLSVYMAPNL